MSDLNVRLATTPDGQTAIIILTQDKPITLSDIKDILPKWINTFPEEQQNDKASEHQSRNEERSEQNTTGTTTE